MNDYHHKFPELFQFFGGYFYQGWAADYRWEGVAPSFAPVIRHFKAVNPPQTVVRVRSQLEELLADASGDDAALGAIAAALGSNFYPPAENLDFRRWLTQIVEILRESPTTARVLRELR